MKSIYRRKKMGFKDFVSEACLALFFLVAICTNSALASTVVTSPGQAFDENEFSKSVSKHLPEPQVLLPNAVPASDRIQMEVYELYQKARAVFEEELEYRLSHMSDEEALASFKADMDANKMQFLKEGIGRLQWTLMDGVPFARIVHFESKLSFVYINAELIDEEGKNFKRYLARQHFDAGRLEDISGRDVAIFKVNRFVEETGLPEVRVSLRPRFLSFKGLAEYFNAFYIRPTAGDVVLGGICAGLQFGLAFGVSAVGAYLHDQPLSWTPAVLSIIWGGTLGTFAVTNKNWRDLGRNEFFKFLKTAFPGVMFAYTLKGIEKGSAALFSATQNAAMWWNIFFSNLAKMEWYDIADARGRLRLNSKKISFTIPVVKVPVEFSRHAFEQQMWYLVPFSLRLPNLIAPEYAETWVMLLASLPIAYATQYSYLKMLHMGRKRAHRLNPSPITAAHLHEIEAELRGMPLRWKKRLVGAAHSLVKFPIAFYRWTQKKKGKVGEEGSRAAGCAENFAQSSG